MGGLLMDFELTESQQAVMASFRHFLAESEAAWRGAKSRNQVDRRRHSHSPEFAEFLRASGWSGVGWPESLGGLGLSACLQWVMAEELAYNYLPSGGLTLSSIGPT